MKKVGLAVGIVGSTARASLWLALGALTLGAAVATRQAFAQPADEQVTLLSSESLQDLVGPIALYPDDLVGIVLPASTFPLQVVEAGRFLDKRAANSTLQPDEDWDDSVVALLNYPDVVKLMNDDLDWTWKLGDAVINQRAAVLDAIQGFRDRAYAAGNLRSDDRQVVENDEGAIAIKPADPEVIYVPYYEPERVVVYQTAPVYHYYPWAYPVYYYPYPVGYSFHTGYFFGVTSAFVIGWHSHFLNVHHHDYYGHPYYGHHYYDPFYVRHDANVSVSRGSYVWEPHYRRGAQPFTRSDGRRFTGTREGQRDGGAQGSYRNGDGAANRSSGQQRTQPLDPQAAARAAESRNRTTPGATPGTSPRAPRTDGGGTYRSGSSDGNARTAPPRTGGGATTSGSQRAGGANGSAPSGRQANPPVRSRLVNPPERPAAQASPGQPAGDPAPQRADSPVARPPGQYRSGGGMSQALRQPPVRTAPGSVNVGRADDGRDATATREPGQGRSGSAPPRYRMPEPRQQAAPVARAAPAPPAERSAAPAPAERRAAEPRVSGGGNANRTERTERAASPRMQQDDSSSSRGDGGGARSAPSYRGGGEGGSNGGRRR